MSFTNFYLQPEVYPQSAAFHLCGQLLPQWFWWYKYCCPQEYVGSQLLQLYWNLDLSTEVRVNHLLNHFLTWIIVITQKDIAGFYFVIFRWEMALPLGPFTSFTSIIFSETAFLLLTYSLTMQPASFRASTALLWVTSLTSTSFTRSIESLTLYREKEREHWINSQKKPL